MGVVDRQRLRGTVEAVDLVGGMISAAVDARRAGRSFAADVSIGGLTDLAESGGGSEILVDRVLADTLGAWTDMMWQAGWQPADIAHVIRRRHSGLPLLVVVDCMAARLSRYPASTVDERFRTQLAALGANAAGGEATGFLGHWWRRVGARPDAVIEAVVDLVAVLAGLSRLQRLCPAPGEARTLTRQRDRAGAKVLERARALLAGDSESDAVTAQEIVIRHSIEAALRGATPGAAPQEPAGIRFGVDAPYEAEKVLLLNEVALANRCRTVWVRELGLVTVLGFPADLRAVELLYPSLLAQATRAMTSGDTRTRGFRQSYLRAFGIRVGQRLRTASEAEVRTGATDNARLLPVLASREAAVKRHAAQLFPTMAPVATSYDLIAPSRTDPALADDPVAPQTHPEAIQDPLF